MIEGYKIINTDTNEEVVFNNTSEMKQYIIDNKDYSSIFSGNLQVINYPNTESYFDSFFEGLSGINTLDLTNFDFGLNGSTYIISTRAMFKGCTNMNQITIYEDDNILNYDLTDMSEMFMDCTNLYTVNMYLFGIPYEVTDISSMFKNCYSLENIENSPFYYWEHITNMTSVFENCSNLYSTPNINFDSFNKQNICNNMFKGCTYLYGVDLSGMKVTQTTSMFEGCTGLKEVTMINATNISGINASRMFADCTNLETVYSKGCKFNSYCNIEGMFSGCVNLKMIDITYWGGMSTNPNDLNIGDLFYNCRNLTIVNEGNTFMDLVGDDNTYLEQIKGMVVPTNLLNDYKTSTQWGKVGDKIKTMDEVNYSYHNLTDDILVKFGSSFTLKKHIQEWRIYGKEVDLKICNSPNSLTDLKHFFNNNKVKSLDLSEFEIDGCTKMESVFSNCTNLTSLDLSGWNTSGVSVMNGMFYNCTSLTSLDLSGWNTSAVYDMSYMFSLCSSLTSLDLSGWNTSSVNTMSGMFQGCNYLTSLDLSGWNTSGVSNMNGVFSLCSSLTSLDLSTWNTSGVSGMGSIFYKCSGLTSLDLSNWNTSGVSYMNDVFYGCSSLTSLDLSSFDFSNVIVKDSMLSSTDSLTTGKALAKNQEDCNFLNSYGTDKPSKYDFTVKEEPTPIPVKDYYVLNLDTNNFIEFDNSVDLFYWVTHNNTDTLLIGNVKVKNETNTVSDLSGMFFDCSSLTSLDLTEFDTTNSLYLDTFFNNCESLTTINFKPNFIKNTCTSLRETFFKCSSLTTLDLSDWDTSNVNEMTSMFYECSSLTTLDLSGFDTSSVNDMSTMFCLCSSLTSLDLSGWDTSNVDEMRSMFNSCSSLTSLDLSGFDTSSVNDTSYMFSLCSSLTSLDLSGFDFSNVTVKGAMLTSTDSLTTGKALAKNQEDCNFLNNGTDKPTKYDFTVKPVINLLNFPMFRLMIKRRAELPIPVIEGYYIENLDTGTKQEFEDTQAMKDWINDNKTNAVLTGNVKIVNVPNTITDMSTFFNECENITSINLEHFNTDGATSMASMFRMCLQVLHFDLSNFDTSSVNNMSDMFINNVNMETLNVLSFDTSNVTNMQGMFALCDNGLVSPLDLSSWDLSSVTNMNVMFLNTYLSRGYGRTSSDVSKLNTQRNVFILKPV